MRADRLLAILLRLHLRGKLTAKDLAKELEVSRRTILRDITALGIAGVPIYAEGGRTGGIHLDPTYRVNLTGLTEAEALALGRVLKRLPLESHEHQQAADLALMKLLTALPTPQRLAVQRIQERVHLDPNSWWQERVAPPSLEMLEQAIFEERRLRIRYEHRDGTLTESSIEPYGLVDKVGSWYLVAQRVGEWRTYRVERLREVCLLDDRFERQEPFDLAVHWREQSKQFESSIPLFHCTLHVPREELSRLEKYVAGRFHLVEDNAEENWIEVTLRLASFDEACILVWGLGDRVHIVTPQALRDAVVARAQAIARSNWSIQEYIAGREE
jgi:predicted DNA-binding transcriptional regulator YafY